MDAISNFIESIYEAAVIPEFWPKVLNTFSTLAEAKDSILSVQNKSGIRAIGSTEQFKNLFQEHYQYSAGRERTRRLIALQRAGFSTDTEFFSPEEILCEPLFGEFLIPKGYGLGIATAIHTTVGDTIVLHAEKAFKEGPYTSSILKRLDGLRPHLARSALLASHLSVERARAVAQVLESIGLPAAILDKKGCLLSANALFVSLIPSTIQDRSDRVRLVNNLADQLLESAVSGICQPFPNAAVYTIPIPASQTEAPIILHLIPIKGAAHDVFMNSSSILLATPVVPRSMPNSVVLQALFDLTPAEAQVAQHVGNGDEVHEIALKLGKTSNTIRNQIASVLSKSGLRRKVDLVALLQSSILGTVSPPKDKK